MLDGISMTCFAGSYGVALCLEVSRLFFRVRLRMAVLAAFVTGGLIAHAVYLAREAQAGIATGTPLSSWYHGCLLMAWLLAVGYLAFLLMSRGPSAAGLFALPVILGLVLVAQIFPRTAQLSSESTYRIWSVAHGVALLLGTLAVLFGFVCGLLYLLQSRRLKRKVLKLTGLRLPSLERLQRYSEGSLVFSCWFLVIGLTTGILLNWSQGDKAVLTWTDPVVWPSAILLVWLVAVLAFNAFYRPARQGRKVAYLTLASFLFLGFVLTILLLKPTAHGGRDAKLASHPMESLGEHPHAP